VAVEEEGAAAVGVEEEVVAVIHHQVEAAEVSDLHLEVPLVAVEVSARVAMLVELVSDPVEAAEEVVSCQCNRFMGEVQGGLHWFFSLFEFTRNILDLMQVPVNKIGFRYSRGSLVAAAAGGAAVGGVGGYALGRNSYSRSSYGYFSYNGNNYYYGSQYYPTQV